MNTTNEQGFTLVGGSRFIITDFVLTRNGINVYNARQLSVRSAPSSVGYLLLDDQNNDTLQRLIDNDTYVSLLKGDFTQPEKYIVGPNIYATLYDSEGQACTCNFYVWGYVVA